MIYTLESFYACIVVAWNDKVDSEKIARLPKSGMFPMAYVYPHNGDQHVIAPHFAWIARALLLIMGQPNY